MPLIKLPEDETFVVEGVIQDITTSGGGYPYAPPFTHLVVAGQMITVRNNDRCRLCGGARRGTGYGKGDTVVVSDIHDHYVVRQVPATTQTVCGAR